MDVAIMQPYFFPYLAYFQLMGSANIFVIHDDVQYIKGGWINRNRMRRDEAPVWLSMPVLSGPHDLMINERRFDLGQVDRICRKLVEWYADANFANELADVIRLVRGMEHNVATGNEWLLQRMVEKLELECQLVRSSELGLSQFKGQAKVIEICKSVGAKRYINPIGGVALYEEADFEAAGIELRFLKTLVSPVAFPSGPVHLSIVDRLVSDGVKSCLELMYRFELLHHHDVLCQAQDKVQNS